MLRMYVREAERLTLSPLDPAAPAQHAGEEAAAPAAQTAVLWYDLINPALQEVRHVERDLGITVPTRDEMEEIELSARLYQEDGAEFMTVTALSKLDGDVPMKTPVTFILKGATLVTVRYADPKPFALFAARALRANGHSYAAGEEVMLGILESVVDRMADVLERIGNEIDMISHEVFRSKTGSSTKKTKNLQLLIEQLGQKGDFLSSVRESLVSISRMVAYHAAVETSGRKVAKEVRQMVKLLQRDTVSLGDHATFLSGKINFLLDATLGLINLEQNQIIKIFTVASVVFLPPTMIASIYGMNFQMMPELNWSFGYPWAIMVMLLSAVGPFYYFKRRGWL
ncbi:magnesium and cobalt transport protein CorA [Rhizobium rhizosphaerae]|uniref:Magnesium transport protein CorA n=1 Tax=Xaviernesmea rhizosphaerae TaxID=1672749 RepID=A0A1Q9APD6_9HYPH|nr:magnesium/cobalt transporter CorA [Xaviernesmea rhizosphaerae]OLP57240.1 magnesium and cobalt transport protein CorA [Xaviernesmea rhizosphaerae]OQP87656.1 magnesium and cobalt transport protein CorA [Xaviernesmea rhizosphaerae]